MRIMRRERGFSSHSYALLEQLLLRKVSLLYFLRGSVHNPAKQYVKLEYV